MPGLSREEFCELERKALAGEASEQELATLEPYRAKRAVLLASGFGSRMLPVTETCPKPLVRVNGRRIIDTLLDALVAAGIEEIWIVRGYLGECFDELLVDYPQIRFIDNPDYATTNNISSALLAVEHMRDAYVFESDLFLKNPALISRYQYESNYLGVPVERTEDWCFSCDEQLLITDLKRGGEKCWHMYGISYWTAADGEQLARDIPREFAASAETQQRFWDDVPCVLCNSSYRLRVRECSFSDIDEIDSFDELCSIDASYESLR